MVPLALLGIVLLLVLLMLLQGIVGFLVGILLIGLTSSLVRQSLKFSIEKSPSSPSTTTSVDNQQDYFKEFVDCMPVPVFIKNTEGCTLYVNSCYESILGSGWIGKSVWDFYPEAVAKQMIADDQAAMKSGKIQVTEGVPVHDGSGRLFQTIKFPLYQNEQQMLLAGFGIDVSKRQFIDASLEKVNAELTIFNAQLEHHNRNNRLLLKFITALQNCQELTDVIAIVDEFIPQLLPQYAGLVAILLPKHQSLHVITTWGLPDKPPDINAVPCNDCCLRFCKTFPRIEQTYPGEICSYWHGTEPVYYTCIPVYGSMSANPDDASLITGIINFYQPNGTAIPDIALQLGQSALVAINQTMMNLHLHHSLHEQSIRDPLTNLFNRRYLQETLRRELSRANRENIPVSIIVIDIDHFKAINDTYGHAMGDLVLKQLGQLLQSQTRQGDVACRYGGEEFVVVLPTATSKTSYYRAEEIRLAFAAISIACETKTIQATLSVGIATYPFHGETHEAVFGAADAALYLAKSKGRNQTVISMMSTKVSSIDEAN